MQNNHMVGEMQLTQEDQTLGLLKRSWERVHWQCATLSTMVSTSVFSPKDGQVYPLEDAHRAVALKVLHLGDRVGEILRSGSLTEDIEGCMQQLFPVIDPLSGILLELEGTTDTVFVALKEVTQVLYDEIPAVLHALALFSSPEESTLPQETAAVFAQELDFIAGYRSGL